MLSVGTVANVKPTDEDDTELPHDIDIDSVEEYPDYGGRKEGVPCRRCGQISSGTGMHPTWIDSGHVDRNAKCYNSKLPLYF